MQLARWFRRDFNSFPFLPWSIGSQPTNRGANARRGLSDISRSRVHRLVRLEALEERRVMNVAPIAQPDAYTVEENGELILPSMNVGRLVIDSEPGDPVGQGIDWNLTSSDGPFSVYRDEEYVGISYYQPFLTETYWRMRFAAADGSPLVPGSYEDARQIPVADNVHPGLDVNHAVLNAQRYDNLTGRFTIQEAVYRGDREVLSFAAEFEQHAYGGPAGLTGSVQFVRQAAGVVLNDTDADGDVLSAAVVDGPRHGYLNLNASGQLGYSPMHNFQGTDSFTYRVSDGALESNIATVHISVVRRNDPPFASSGGAEADEDTPLAIRLTGQDGDADVDQPLAFAIFSGPYHGVLSGLDSATGQVTYTPDPDYHGADVFSYTVSEADPNGSGRIFSMPAYFHLNVRSRNDAPRTGDDVYAVNVDESLVVTPQGAGVLANDWDADGDSLAATLVQGPQHGSVQLNFDGTFTYTPTTGFRGEDFFTYVATDGILTSRPTEARIIVSDEGSPIAYGQIAVVTEDQSLQLVLAGDAEATAGASVFVLESPPSHGILIGFDAATGRATYKPDQNYFGPDSFTFRVRSSGGGGPFRDSNLATVTLSVLPVNDPFLALPIPDLEVVEDTPAVYLDLTPYFIDVDNEPRGDGRHWYSITRGIQQNPAGPFIAHQSGILNHVGLVEVKLRPDRRGELVLDLRGMDSSGVGVETSVVIRVKPVNDAPQGIDARHALQQDTSLPIALSGRDGDVEIIQSLTFTILEPPRNGTLTDFDPATGEVTYSPNPGYFGPDSFQFAVADDDRAGGAAITSLPATVSLQVRATYIPPLAEPDVASALEDTTITLDVLANDTFTPDARDLARVVEVTPAAHGTVTIVQGGTRVVYTPHADYLGEEVFRYTVDDGQGGIATAEVRVAVINPRNELLAAAADAGGQPLVRLFDSETSELRDEFFAYDPRFTGGVRVAMADVTGDGTPDIIAAAGPGGGPHVRVFDGITGEQAPGAIGSFYAYNPAFTGGVFVGAADFNGDGRADIVTGADAGGGPHIRVFSGLDGTELAGFFDITKAFRGVRVATGDIDGDGTPDIIAAPGSGGLLPGVVRVFSGLSGQEVDSFAGRIFPYLGFRGGVYVASGDVNGDGRDDVITGAGAGGGPHVRAFSGVDGSELASFYAYSAAFTGGVRVGVGDVDQDGDVEIITGAGPGGGPHVRAFDVLDDGEVASFFAFHPAFTGGVFVAGSPLAGEDSNAALGTLQAPAWLDAGIEQKAEPAAATIAEEPDALPAEPDQANSRELAFSAPESLFEDWSPDDERDDSSTDLAWPDMADLVYSGVGELLG